MRHCTFPLSSQMQTHTIFCVSQRAQNASGASTPDSSTPTADATRPPAATEEQGDASCHGFWERGRTTIFDMCIMDTDARSYWKKKFAKVLEQHEMEKKNLGISRTAWKCRRILHVWFTLWMALQVARLGMRRSGWPLTWPASGIVSILRWCIM